ncbi:hypothetical protein [Thiomonas sp.]
MAKNDIVLVGHIVRQANGREVKRYPIVSFLDGGTRVELMGEHGNFHSDLVTAAGNGYQMESPDPEIQARWATAVKRAAERQEIASRATRLAADSAEPAAVS